MSVIKSKRQESKLAVLTKAYELATYTITICKNEKAFPKRDRWLLTQPIVRECLDAVTCIRRANAVRVATQKGNARGALLKMDAYYQELFKEVPPK